MFILLYFQVTDRYNTQFEAVSTLLQRSMQSSARLQSPRRQQSLHVQYMVDIYRSLIHISIILHKEFVGRSAAISNIYQFISTHISTYINAYQYMYELLRRTLAKCGNPRNLHHSLLNLHETNIYARSLHAGSLQQHAFNAAFVA